MNLNTLIADFRGAHESGMTELIRQLVTAAVIAVAGRIVASLAKRVVNRAVNGRLKLDENLGSMLKIAVTYGVLIICAIMILDVFGINTASLIAVLGAAGVAVGLALKDTLSNIASGIILLLQRTYRKGDYIECGTVSGTVTAMDLFTTTLETPDGVYISAPNSAIWGAPIRNYTRNGRRRIEFTLGIDYNDSIDAAFALMRSIAAGEPRFLADPAPQVLVQSLGDSAVNIVLRAWAANDVYWSLYFDQLRNIKEKADAAGLHIPFPQRAITIRTEG